MTTKEQAIHLIIKTIDENLENANLYQEVYLIERREINLKKLRNEICKRLTSSYLCSNNNNKQQVASLKTLKH